MGSPLPYAAPASPDSPARCPDREGTPARPSGGPMPSGKICLRGSATSQAGNRHPAIERVDEMGKMESAGKATVTPMTRKGHDPWLRIR